MNGDRAADTMTIMVSFHPTKMKLFRSKKKSLLVIDGTCINGSRNRICPGNKALVHVRPSSSLPANIDCVEGLAHDLILDEKPSPQLSKGCWVDADSTKRVVIKAHANIERNRRGDRLMECTDFLAVEEKDDGIYLPTTENDEYNEYRVHASDEITPDPINLKCERHKIFAYWLIETYGQELLSQGSGVMDVAGGNGMISCTLSEMGIPSTLLDPHPRYGTCTSSSNIYVHNDGEKTNNPPFGVIPYPLNGDGADLTSRKDDISYAINNCSLICGLHPDQATEPIVTLALRLNVPFAIVPCCVMPSLFPDRVQKRYNNDPVRSYSAFCQYLLDMAPLDEKFLVDYLPFVGRNKVIYRRQI